MLHLQKENELVCLLLATWTEHAINGIILLQCRNIGIGRDEINNIIREVQMRGKITWLFRLIGLPRIPTNHISNILRIFEERNKYVHYKWKEFDMDKPSPEEVNIELILKRYRGTIRYLKHYQTKNTLIGTVKRIGKIGLKYRNLTTG